MDLRATLEELRNRVLAEIKKLKDEELQPDKLKERLAILRQEIFNRKGELAKALKRLSEIIENERPSMGELANKIKEDLEQALSTTEQTIQSKTDLGQDSFDPTLSGLAFSGFSSLGGGHVHPLTVARYELTDICERLGLSVVEGPELESEFYNFDALNILAGHAARDMQSTFWLKPVVSGQAPLLLRTHTSNQQVRALRAYGVPFYGVFPGRVYRYEATDARHDNTFDQFEGLVVDKNISVAHMLGVLETTLNEFLGRELVWRARPGYFPFVEPGLELDAACLCGGHQPLCRLCKGTGWMELLGCGLVHPKVLQAGGVDPQQWSGFAFGIGFTRLVMLRYNIPDIRLLLGGDIKFLRQF